MALPKNIGDRDHAAYKENPTDQGVDRRVTDLESQTKLDAILAALGGSSNTTANVFNIAVATSGTEISQVLPANTKSFILKSRGRSVIQLAYSVTESSTNYITLKAGTVYTDVNFYTTQTIYFQTSKDLETVELIAFT